MTHENVMPGDVAPAEELVAVEPTELPLDPPYLPPVLVSVIKTTSVGDFDESVRVELHTSDVFPTSGDVTVFVEAALKGLAGGGGKPPLVKVNFAPTSPAAAQAVEDFLRDQIFQARRDKETADAAAAERPDPREANGTTPPDDLGEAVQAATVKDGGRC